MGSPDRRRAGLAYAAMAHLALSHQIAHRPNRILDRHGRINAVDVVEVDDISFEPSQAALAASLDVFRSAVRGRRAVSRAQITELAGDYVFIAMTPCRASDQFLVAAELGGRLLADGPNTPGPAEDRSRLRGWRQRRDANVVGAPPTAVAPRSDTRCYGSTSQPPSRMQRCMSSSAEVSS